jgi:hypothetical protein
MLLLLTALRAADGAMLPSGQNGFDAHYLSALLSQNDADAKVALKDHRLNLGSGGGYFIPTARPEATFKRNLPVASLATFRIAWAMRPPAAHSASLHTATSFAI